jgi:hypothetical protein
MPVEQTNVVVISCDNPACPGNSLDPNDRTGWTFISAEVYGQPTVSYVYCSAACAGTVEAPLADAEAARSAGAPA